MLIFRMLGLAKTTDFNAVKSAFETKMNQWKRECDELVRTLRYVNQVLENCDKKLAEAELEPYSIKVHSLSPGEKIVLRDRVHYELKQQKRIAEAERHREYLLLAAAQKQQGIDTRERIEIMQQIQAERIWPSINIRLRTYQQEMPINLSDFNPHYINECRTEMGRHLSARAECIKSLEQVLELRRGLRELYSKIDTPETFRLQLVLDEKKTFQLPDIKIEESNPLTRTLTTPTDLDRVVAFPIVGRPIAEQLQHGFWGTRSRRHTRVESSAPPLPKLKEPDAPLPYLANLAETPRKRL